MWKQSKPLQTVKTQKHPKHAKHKNREHKHKTILKAAETSKPAIIASQTHPKTQIIDGYCFWVVCRVYHFITITNKYYVTFIFLFLVWLPTSKLRGEWTIQRLKITPRAHWSNWNIVKSSMETMPNS